jgi:hypothetical protein
MKIIHYRRFMNEKNFITRPVFPRRPPDPPLPLPRGDLGALEIQGLSKKNKAIRDYHPLPLSKLFL